MKHLKVKFVKNVFLCLKVPMATHMGTESNGFDVRFPSNLFNVTLPPPPPQNQKTQTCIILSHAHGRKQIQKGQNLPPTF